MKEIEVHCPTCNKKGRIEIEDDLSSKMSRGLVAIDVEKDKVCSHAFIAYVDKNYKVRDCFTADFKIEVPEEAPIEAESKVHYSIENLDIDLIRLNLTNDLITNSLRALFFKKKVLVISEQAFLFNHFQNFFKFITQDSFTFDILFLTGEEFEKNKKNYEPCLAIKGNSIVTDSYNLIDPKKLKEEQKIVEKFVQERDLMSSLIILKNEIQKVFEMAKSIADFAKKSPKKFNSKTIISKLNEDYKTKIPLPYINFLIDIVENYFGINVPKDTGVSEFLGII